MTLALILAIWAASGLAAYGFMYAACQASSIQSDALEFESRIIAAVIAASGPFGLGYVLARGYWRKGWRI